MKNCLRVLILGQFLFALACTKATPEFELLDQNAIPQPKFNGATVKNLTTSSSALTFAITGECDQKIRSIQAKAVNATASFAALDSVANSSPTVQCSSNGTFSFTLKSLTGLGFASLTLGNTYEVQLVGMTSAGLSRPSSIYISYSNGTGNPNLKITAGGIHGGGDNAFMATDGTAFKAELHVGFTSKSDPGAGNMPTDGSGYTLHPGGFAR